MFSALFTRDAFARVRHASSACHALTRYARYARAMKRLMPAAVFFACPYYFMRQQERARMRYAFARQVLLARVRAMRYATALPSPAFTICRLRLLFCAALRAMPSCRVCCVCHRNESRSVMRSCGMLAMSRYAVLCLLFVVIRRSTRTAKRVMPNTRHARRREQCRTVVMRCAHARCAGYEAQCALLIYADNGDIVCPRSTRARPIFTSH